MTQKSTTFTITPEKEASFSQFLYRQLFVNPKALSRRDVDLSGKTAIVTGSSGGIGLECARQLLDLGISKLILAVRNESKAKALVDGLSAKRDIKPSIEVWRLDYLSYDSIIDFVNRAKDLERLDIVVLNAGIYRTTVNLVPSTGHEENIQVNYLSTVLLMPEPGRLTVVSSDTAAWYNLKEKNEDPLLPSFDKHEPNFHHHERYGTSKLLGQLFITELAKRIPPSVAIVNCVNPGFCHSSGLTRDADGTFLGLVVGVMVRLLGRSPSVGARSVVDAAVYHGEEVHGQYLEDCILTPMAPFVYSPDQARVMPRLWKETMNELAFANVESAIQELSS
ncbi:hypothetical protein O1611_g4936 [Lasiodiplodia mahajangana]|uniref:Uncharacterized protein n=1 Tax=Lasiodiplodia mahajangana TaxID=1108764 RepID=A0ACC2JMR9_9PEZI|nr:hypothetical protein O1611_g4936 [Lasiodiplodia mahajangana]